MFSYCIKEMSGSATSHCKSVDSTENIIQMLLRVLDLIGACKVFYSPEVICSVFFLNISAPNLGILPTVLYIAYLPNTQTAIQAFFRPSAARLTEKTTPVTFL